MTLLDYNVMPDFLARRFNRPGQIRARLVGPDRSYDSGYFDIIRFYGDMVVNPAAVAVAYASGERAVADSIIENYARRMERLLRDAGRLYDGPPVMSLSEAAFHRVSPVVTVQSCDYGLFAGCCFALDRRDESFRDRGETLREYYKATYPTTGLADHPLVPGLGVCGLLLLRDDSGQARSLLTVRRSAHLASLGDSTGPSAAGSIDFTPGYANLAEMICRGMGLEVEEELGLRPDEYTVVPLAYGREIFRGEKPQFFCVIETPLTTDDIELRIRSLTGKREFDRYTFESLGLHGRLNGSVLSELNHEARMNYCLLDEWLVGQAGVR